MAAPDAVVWPGHTTAGGTALNTPVHGKPHCHCSPQLLSSRNFFGSALQKPHPLRKAKGQSFHFPNSSFHLFPFCRCTRLDCLQILLLLVCYYLSKIGLATVTHVLFCLLLSSPLLSNFSLSSVFAIEQSSAWQCGPHPTRPDETTKVKRSSVRRSPLVPPPLPPPPPPRNWRTRSVLITVTSFRGFLTLPLLQTLFSNIVNLTLTLVAAQRNSSFPFPQAHCPPRRCSSLQTIYPPQVLNLVALAVLLSSTKSKLH